MSMIKANKGFSLVEIMISVFILGVGLLGLAKLQVTSLKVNQSASVRTMVTALASDMFDYMRANQVAAEAGDYILTQEDEPPTGTEVADTDIQLWFANMNTVLPANSDASISCQDSITTDTLACSPGSIYTVNIIWNEFNQSSDAIEPITFTYTGTL